MGRKLGAVPLFWGGKLSHHLTQSPGPRPTSILSGILSHQAVWPQRTWAENWRAVPLFMGADWSPFNIMWRGPRPTCTSSFILIHSIVWLQYTNITDRTAQTGQRSDSTRRTVLQTVAHKWRKNSETMSHLQYCEIAHHLTLLFTVLGLGGSTSQNVFSPVNFFHL